MDELYAYCFILAIAVTAAILAACGVLRVQLSRPRPKPKP